MNIKSFARSHGTHKRSVFRKDLVLLSARTYDLWDPFFTPLFAIG